MVRSDFHFNKILNNNNTVNDNTEYNTYNPNIILYQMGSANWRRSLHHTSYNWLMYGILKGHCRVGIIQPETSHQWKHPMMSSKLVWPNIFLIFWKILIFWRKRFWQNFIFQKKIWQHLYTSVMSYSVFTIEQAVRFSSVAL